MGLFSTADLEYMFWNGIRNGSIGTVGAKGDPGGITLGVSLSTEDLNTLVTSGMYRQTNSANATVARNYPKDSISGVLMVMERIGAGASASIFQVWYPAVNLAVGTPTTYIRYSVTGNSLWTPWRAFNSTRVDQTAGRAIYQWDDLNGRDQLIYGDTGWRDISTLTVSGVGVLRIRRTGYLVTITATAVSNTSTNPGNFVTLLAGSQIAGFNSGITVRQPATTSVGNVRILESLVSGELRLFDPEVATYSFTITYPTNDAWPTILPGSAVNTIPNL